MSLMLEQGDYLHTILAHNAVITQEPQSTVNYSNDGNYDTDYQTFSAT